MDHFDHNRLVELFYFGHNELVGISGIILLGSQLTSWDHDGPFGDHNGLMELFCWDQN